MEYELVSLNMASYGNQSTIPFCARFYKYIFALHQALTRGLNPPKP